MIKQVVTDTRAYIGPTIMGAVDKIKTFWTENWELIKDAFQNVLIALGVILSPVLMGLDTSITALIGLAVRDEIVTDIIEEMDFRIDRLRKYERQFAAAEIYTAATNSRNRRDELERILAFVLNLSRNVKESE